MLILASASPRRRQLLQMLGLEFEARPQPCREQSQSRDPADYVTDIALQKAQSAQAQAGPEDWILAADTAVCLDGKILGKPTDPEDARRMLTLLSGQRIWRWQERTDVEFYPLSQQLICWYISTGEPMDKAGAYGAQGLGALLVKGVQGDFYNVMGLPLASLVRVLQQAGFGFEPMEATP